MKRGKRDELNDFAVCDPEIAMDELPQPLAFVDQLLQSDILQEVFKEIHRIEKDKHDCNYDGRLRELACQYSP